MREVPKLQNWVTWPTQDPFWPNFAFFSFELTAIRLRAKFAVASFNGSGDIRGSQNSKSGSREPRMTTFDLILRFLLEFTAVRLVTKFEVSSFSRWRDIRGSQNCNFAFFSLELTAVRLHTKFEVSSFNCSRDIRRIIKLQNWVTWHPHDPFDPILHFFS